MKSWAKPTDEQIEAARLRLMRPQARIYFFERLENPFWLAPLARIHAFSEPPPALVLGGDRVQFSSWPEGVYLRRVAADVPDEVTKVLLDLPRTNNPLVAQVLLECALQLPHSQVERLKDRVRDWIEVDRAELYVREATEIIKRLLEFGFPASAVSAAEALLQPRPDPGLERKLLERLSAEFASSPEASSRLGDFSYGRTLKELVGPLVDQAGVRAVRMLSRLLSLAEEYSQWPGQDTAGYGFVTRPSIGDHSQNTGFAEVLDSLISAVRDAALQYAARGEEATREVIRILDGIGDFHDRIALHVLAQASGCEDLVSARLANPQAFDTPGIRHEYAELLRHRFTHATQEARSIYLQWVSDGPDLEEYRSNRERFDDVPIQKEDLDRFARVWKRDRFSYVSKYLDDVHLEEYEALVAELGESEHPDFAAWHTSWIGPESPLPTQDLNGLPMNELLQYLRSWTPESDESSFPGPSREGLGRALLAVVKPRANEFAAVADQLTDLNPTYVQHILEGIGVAAPETADFNWGPVLALASYVVSQPWQADDYASNRGGTFGWQWVRRQISWLLRKNTSGHGAVIPIVFRNKVWEILKRLTEDPNPTPEYEIQYGGSNMDPYTLSLNSNRSAAVHGVLEYALWVLRDRESVGHQTSFADMPEVAKLLERHLEPEVDPSVAVRAVYGKWLPWLHLIDSEWTERHLMRIFPADEEWSILRDAAWDTYIKHCGPYDSIYKTLAREYDWAIARVPSTASDTRMHENRDVRLGQHLIVLWERGVVTDSVLSTYFKRADDELNAQLMEFVGHGLSKSGDAPSEELLKRIRTLWEERFRTAQEEPAVHEHELAAFVYTFASEKLDPSWSLQMLETIATISSLKPEYILGEPLVRHARRDPAATVRVLQRLLTGVTEAWEHYALHDGVLEIAKLAIMSGDEVAAKYAREIASYYVEQGFLEFRSVLK